MLCHNSLRGLVQIAGAGVIAQPGPQVQNLIERSSCQGSNGGEILHKALKIRNNGRHLSLL